MEGEFTMRRGDNKSQVTKERKYFGKEDSLKRNDNIKFSGEFSQRERRLWCPGDQVVPCHREDNLRMEGEFTMRRGDEKSHREDNLRLEGDFGQTLRISTGEDRFCGRRDKNVEPRDEKVWHAGNRVRLSKMEEQLRGEGKFCKNKDILAWKDDMTRFAGNVSQREDARWNPDDMVGPNRKEERLPRKQQDLRAKDNLRLEGEFCQREARGWNPGERVKPCWRGDNLVMEGEFSKREDVILQDEILRRFSTRGKARALNAGGRAGVWDRGEMVAKVVRPDNLSLR